jgi:rubrerythrin
MSNNVITKWPHEQLKVLDICQQIYKQAEEFYQYLADIHKEYREIARMWGELAVDKCNHSDAYKMANRLKGDGISGINSPLDNATNLLNKMKSIPKENRINPPSVEEALRFTVKMEESLNALHFIHVVKFFNEQDTFLMASSLKSSSNILHMLTEEYLNLTILDTDAFE